MSLFLLTNFNINPNKKDDTFGTVHFLCMHQGGDQIIVANFISVHGEEEVVKRQTKLCAQYLDGPFLPVLGTFMWTISPVYLYRTIIDDYSVAAWADKSKILNV